MVMNGYEDETRGCSERSGWSERFEELGRLLLSLEAGGSGFSISLFWSRC